MSCEDSKMISRHGNLEHDRLHSICLISAHDNQIVLCLNRSDALNNGNNLPGSARFFAITEHQP